MVLLSSRFMFVYDQVPILQVKSQTARMCDIRGRFSIQCCILLTNCLARNHTGCYSKALNRFEDTKRTVLHITR